MNRRIFLLLGAHSTLVWALAGKSLAQTVACLKSREYSLPVLPDLPNQVMPDLIGAPDDPASWPSFREMLFSWRKEMKKNSSPDSRYDRPEYAWCSSAYNCYFLMMGDRLFLDPEKGEFTVERFLEYTEKEFGRIDMVVLWHAYPRIGLDERNQFDFYREMPGGIPQLRKITDEFHRRNVKVFINYNPWDTGTRQESASDSDLLSSLIGDLDADGIFLDTLSEGNPELLEKVEAVKDGVAFESELALPAEQIPHHQMSWAQWFTDTPTPGILRNKWLERRHMQHAISRWNSDRTSDLHTAWMNGSGTMIWENVFGQWMGWNQRDKSFLRSISPIQKRYTGLFSGEGWTPLALIPEKEHLYANLWQKEGVRLWTLVNRSDRPLTGSLLCVDHHHGDQYYDLIQGKKIRPGASRGKQRLNGVIPPRGIGCFLALPPSQRGKDFRLFLASQARISQSWNLTADFPALKATRRPVAPTRAYPVTPPGMVRIDAFTGPQQRIFRVRETGCYTSTDPGFINEVYPALHHNVTLQIYEEFPPFLIDEVPVTNRMFRAFLEASGYAPANRENFLRHWNHHEIPHGKEDHPVVYVNLADARAFALWAGKRLPTEGEWQFAGQGSDRRRYPWGNHWSEGKANGGETGDTTPVRTFPEGISPSGCYDLCGNVWEMTESEYLDQRNRFCILKGGSFYQAKGSGWYFDGGPQTLDFSAKMILIAPGLDRCSSVGFRCAADLL